MRRLQSCISFLLASQIQVQIYGAKSCRTSVVLPLSGIVMDSRFLSYGKEKESKRLLQEAIQIVETAIEEN